MTQSSGFEHNEFGVETRRYLDLLWLPDEAREIRIPKHNKYHHTASGYFASPESLLAAAAPWDDRANLYVTLNPVDPALLARANHRIVLKAESTTADADITRRRFFFLDVDPTRPAGISSTDEELTAAFSLLTNAVDFLTAAGWPQPGIALSGNGYYGIYSIDLPNDEESLALISTVLATLAARFNTDHAKIDTSVSNASRLIGLVGSMKVKGDPLPDRPHRRSQLLSIPASREVVSIEQLRALVDTDRASAQDSRTETKRSGFARVSPNLTLKDILEQHGIANREQPPDANGVTWYHLRRCPFHDDGRDFECGVGQTLPNGPFAGHCFHPEGIGRGWKDFKVALGLDLHRDGPTIQTPSPGGDQESPHSFPRTDAGNGELFAHLYGDRIRFDHRRRRWLVWDHHRWSDDADGEVRRLAKLTVRHRYLQAATIADLTERAAEAKFAVASENRQRLDALLVAAQSELPITDAGDAWDADPFLLGVANGVLDLRTGTLRSGRPSDRMTRWTHIAFSPDATCPRWLQFLGEIFVDDGELIDFVWRAIGYSLTGDTREQCVFLCYAPGANGKSVLLKVLRALGGAYAYNTPFTSLEFTNRTGIPNDLAALAGRRIVTASETNEGTRLNEGRLKALTGGDPITARFLHAEFFTFEPEAKFWLAVNHRPTVQDDSYGFWRRVRLVPFMRQFDKEEQDPTLADRLLLELPGILAWAVRGCLAWQQRGLEPPTAVRTPTDSYRAESDPLAAFVDECCVIDPRASCGAAAAYKAYTRWAGNQGMKEREMLTATSFGLRMRGKFEGHKTKQGKVYLGVGLRSETTPVTGSDPNFEPPAPDAPPAVTGLVTGFVPSPTQNAVFSLMNSLTRENMEKPVTTRHPSPDSEDAYCVVCDASVWRMAADGTPFCGAHFPVEEE
jgi:putative DNA primase/helicase